MEKSNELYFMNKYKYLNLSEASSGKTEEELAKEEKRKQKELKKKQMQETCKQKNKKVALNISKDKKIIDETKPGEKKNLDKFPDNYDPSYVESAWNAWWQKESFFKVDLKKSSQFNLTFLLKFSPK